MLNTVFWPQSNFSEVIVAVDKSPAVRLQA